MPKKKTERELLETIAREVAQHTTTLDQQKELLARQSIHIGGLKVDVSDIKRDITKMAETVDRGFRHIDRFMMLHEELQQELAALKADVDRVKKAVKQLGGKID
ncbi:MAG: hypothetical protein HY460_00965 [Parcubacteria group bacterium]|nr:hypothetical protein [Parcubacteria group bacterium]